RAAETANRRNGTASMNLTTDVPEKPATPSPAVLPPTLAPTPLSWRLGIAAAVILVGASAYQLQHVIGLRGQSLAGVFCFFGLVAIFSTNLRAVNWRTIGWGFALQLTLALLVLKGEWTIGDKRYSVYAGFEHAGEAVKQFINFSDKGAEFVFG